MIRLIAIGALFAAVPATADEYAVRVTSVYDGDTIRGDVSNSVELRMPGRRVRLTETWLDETIRLAGCAAPELRAPGGQQSRDWLAKLLPPGTSAVLRTDTRETEKYGRTFGRVIVHGKDVSAAAIAAGMAKPWNGKGPQPQ